MSVYFAAQLVRDTSDRWSGRAVDMDSVDDLDALLDLLRDATADGGLGLFFLEEDDEYFAIARVDSDPRIEPRVFISDSRAVRHFPLAALVMAEAVPAAGGDDDDDEEEGTRPETDPAGDTDLVADLGTPAETLLELSVEEGLLPADVITALCEKAGCADVLERVREE